MQQQLTIARYRVAHLVLPKQDPTWRFALGARPVSNGVVLELTTDDGVVGYGYSSDIPHLGYDLDAVANELASAAAVLTNLPPIPVIGSSVALRALRGQIKLNPAYAAVEMAILDLLGKVNGVPLAVQLGGINRTEIDVLRILSIKTPEKMAANTQLLVDDGYGHVKIKIDNDPWELDAERIIAIREQVGPDMRFTLDANQSYDAETAVKLFDRVESQAIDLFEQPVKVDDLAGLKYVTQALEGRCIVEADESCNSVARAWELVSGDMCSGISLKILKLGGISACLKVAEMCAHAGIACRVGAHVGSRILNAAAFHLASAIPDVWYACELGEFARLNDDPFEGLEVVDGSVTLSSAPGLGVWLREDAQITWQ